MILFIETMDKHTRYMGEIHIWNIMIIYMIFIIIKRILSLSFRLLTS